MEKIKEFFFGLKDRFLSFDRIIAALAASVMVSYVFQMFRHGEFGQLQEYYGSINFAVFFLLAVLFFAVQMIGTYMLKLRYLIPWALMSLTVMFSLLLAVNYSGEGTVYFALGIGVMDLIVVLWEVRGDKLGLSGITVSRKAALISAAILFAAATIAFGYLTSLKYRTYNTFAFDFGVFSQMFERMAQTGLPYTTVERSYMMLHYGVHFSPFFYLFLPGYYIFRTPIYLYFIQAAGVAAGVFAIWLLAGKLGLSGKMTLALEVLYIFYPCLLDGTFNDFHENKFLTTIILFLFYFIVSKKTWGIIGFSFLLLTVKEDAAIYLIAIALFVMFYRKEIWTGLILLGMAIVYFILATQIVAWSGTEGVMMSRLSSYFVDGERTFGSVIKAIVYDLGYVIQQMFTGERLVFMIWMFMPVMLAPFMTKKASSLFLLLPILPINLMPDWQYQYDVNFQYTYGVAAMVIFSTILVLMKLGPERRRTLLLTSLCLCMAMSVLLTAPKIKTVTSNASTFAATYDETDAVLELIPDDATVTASDSMVPHLYKIKWLFTVPEYYAANHDKNPIKPSEADYVVIDSRYLNNEKRGVALTEMMGDNYTEVARGGIAILYERKLKVKVAE